MSPADDIAKLPPKKRAQHYRAMAEEAERCAANATGGLKQSYELMAQQWRKLAGDAERQAE